MDNQHQHIKGYRDLSQDEIALINTIKTLGNQVGEIVGTLDDLDSTDKRWLAIARTDLQQGLMALVRSVAKPTSF